MVTLAVTIKIELTSISIEQVVRVLVQVPHSHHIPSMFDEAIGPRNIKIFYILSPDGSLDI